ncbi:MAG: transcription antitermination factor NusB [Angustibacter sp.]
MSARSKARKRALDILFEADQRGSDPLALVAQRLAHFDPPLNPYTGTLVRGVCADVLRVDELIATYSQGWTIDRMPAVDRIILRIGTWELMFTDEIPDVVAVSEAVELATALSTDESAGFVNGLLSRLLELKPTLIG